MHQIHLFGQPTVAYEQLKKSLQDYIEVSNLKYEVCEYDELANDENIDLHSVSIIEFLGHTLEFKNDTDNTSKLSKFFFLLEASQSEKISTKKQCINCDRCRCQKSLKPST